MNTPTGGPIDWPQENPDMLPRMTPADIAAWDQLKAIFDAINNRIDYLLNEPEPEPKRRRRRWFHHAT